MKSSKPPTRNGLHNEAGRKQKYKNVTHRMENKDVAVVSTYSMTGRI
jgi:hypothetical protein